MNACRKIKKRVSRAAMLFVVLLAAFIFSPITAQAADPSAKASALSVDAILDKVEARYDCESFSAGFNQTSTLKAMNITDTAAGKAVFKRPRNVRWEYTAPTPQQIISDGKTLWIYKPEENQVVIGEAPVLFEKGNGASFMADIRTLREDFNVTQTDPPALSGVQPLAEDCYVLKLDWKEKKFDLGEVYVFVAKASFNIVRVVTISTYDDETVLDFNNIKLNEHVSDELFTFDIPITADVIAFGE